MANFGAFLLLGTLFTFGMWITMFIFALLFPGSTEGGLDVAAMIGYFCAMMACYGD